MTRQLTALPIKAASVQGPLPRHIYVQVLSGTSARLSRDEQTLEQSTGGLTITPTDGILHLEWRGDLWIAGDGRANIEIV